MSAALKAREIEIGGDSGDPFARFRRPKLTVKAEGPETRLLNLADVGAALSIGIGLDADVVAEGLLKQIAAILGVRASVKRTETQQRRRQRGAQPSQGEKRYLLAGKRTPAEIEPILRRIESEVIRCAVCNAADVRFAPSVESDHNKSLQSFAKPFASDSNSLRAVEKRGNSDKPSHSDITPDGAPLSAVKPSVSAVKASVSAVKSLASAVTGTSLESGEIDSAKRLTIANKHSAVPATSSNAEAAAMGGAAPAMSTDAGAGNISQETDAKVASSTPAKSLGADDMKSGSSAVGDGALVGGKGHLVECQRAAPLKAAPSEMDQKATASEHDASIPPPKPNAEKKRSRKSKGKVRPRCSACGSLAHPPAWASKFVNHLLIA